MNRPTTTPRRRDRERTRAALIEAAAGVFARKGFEAASLDEIAAEAGYTRGAFHHHFGSKEELAAAVVERRYADLLAGYGDETLVSWPARARATAKRWHQLHGDHRLDTALMLELRTIAMRDPRLRAVLAEAERRAVASTADSLERHMDPGTRLRYPAAQLAELMHVVSRGLLEWEALDGEGT